MSPTCGLIRLENSLFCWFIFPELSPPAPLQCQHRQGCIRCIPPPLCPARLFFYGFTLLTATGNKIFFFFLLLSLFRHIPLLCKYRLKCSRVWDAGGSTQGSCIAGDAQVAQAVRHKYPLFWHLAGVPAGLAEGQPAWEERVLCKGGRRQLGSKESS